MQSRLSKIIATMLVTVILIANSWPVISYATELFLSEKELESQNTTSKDGSVDFDVSYSNGKHSATINIDEKNTKLNIAVSLKKGGYVKDLAIDFSSSNFEIAQINDEITTENGKETQTAVSEKIQSFDTENKKITFGQITNKERISEQIYINPIIKDEIDEDNFSKDNKIKLTCIFVDTDAKETKVEQEIVVHTEWTAENVETELNYETIKYIPYASNEENKIIVQGKAILNLKDYLLPIKDSKITIDVPKIADEYPEKIWIEKNPDETTVDTSNILHPVTFDYNFKYDKSTGELEIEKKYEVKDGKIKWWKIPLEYKITYVYSSNTYEKVKDKTVKLEYAVNSETTFYGNEDLIVKNKFSVETEQKEKIGEIAELIVKENKNINKGYMYNNANIVLEENKRETEFTNKYELDITYANLIDSFKITQNDDKFITDTNEYMADSYNKKLKISKKEFETIFGEEGKIEIKSQEGTLLSTIDKNTKSEQDRIELDLTVFKVANIVIETSKPQKEGKFNFEITKAITKDSNYSGEKIKSFKKLQSTVNLTANNEDLNIINKNTEVVNQLEEATQKVEITVNNDRWSTVSTNENITMSVTLENDSDDDLLYVNPKTKIILPKNIESIEINTLQLMFDDELKIAEAKIYDNDDGTKTIEMQLEGMQTMYNNSTVKGTTILIVADITLNSLTPFTNTKLEVEVENGDEYKTKSKDEINIKLIPPSGIVTTNSVTGYNGDEKTEVINGESKVAQLAARSGEKELTFEMNIINNYEDILKNVIILGRTMFKGNKDINTLQDLGTTMDLPMSSKITTSGILTENVKIYYSTNENATKNLNDTNNKWSTEIEDYESVKSYLIVLEDYEMKCGDSLKFSYKAKAPENLEYNNSAYEMYGVYFTYNMDTGIIENKASATPIGLNTGKMATLETILTSKIGDGNSVKAGEKLEYTVDIKNTGTVEAVDSTINIDLPENLEYIPEEGEKYRIKRVMPLVKIELMSEPEITEEDIDNMDISETEKEQRKEELRQYIEAMEQQKEFKKEYEAMVEKMKSEGIEFDENITEAKNVLEITVGNIRASSVVTKNITFRTAESYFISNDGKIELIVDVKFNNKETSTSNKVTNYIIKVNFITSVDYSTEDDVLETGKNFQYIVSIASTDWNNPSKNTILELQLPEELELGNIEDIDGNKILEEDIKQEKNSVKIKLGNLSPNDPKTLKITFKIKNFDGELYEKEIIIKGNVSADDINAEDISNIMLNINKPGIKVIQSCNIPENTDITAAENFKYTFTVLNLSKITLEEIVFTDMLPKEVQFKKLEVVYQDGTVDTNVLIDENGNIKKTFSIKGNEQVIINIEVMAKSLPQDSVINNKGFIEQAKVGKLETNIIAHVIKQFNKNNIKPNPGENETELTKRIIGNVWLDENKDGVKDNDEAKIADVKVLLLDESGNIVKNSKGEYCIVATGNDGTYMFNNIYKGAYTIVFLYDSLKYSATAYRKNGVDESKNSDAVDKNVVYDGKEQIAGVTETILVTTENIYNIDFGLIEDAKFDLKLDKIVKKITTTDSKKTVEHIYNNSLAKIDFEAKYIDKSSMIIEYAITVTNEGEVAGYAKKIADYIPKEFKFNSELNKDWYEGNDGTVYNMSLANTIINPGESKTVKLILTKNMNNEDFGIISNSAEIFEVSNNYGLLDIDSIPGNKIEREDDYSIANVIIGVKTGQTIIYCILSLIVIFIIGVGTYVIKKKILK